MNYQKNNYTIQKIYYNRHKEKTYIKNNMSGTLTKTYSGHCQINKAESKQYKNIKYKMNSCREKMKSVYKNHLIMIINIAYPNDLV